MKPIKIIYGNEDYLMERERRIFFAHWQSVFDDQNEIRCFVKDTGVASVVETMEGSSLFAVSGLYMWTECPYLPIKKGGRSRSKLTDEEKWFLEKLSQLGKEQAFLFFCKGNIDTNCAFYKALKSLAETVKYDPVSDTEVLSYIEEHVLESGRKLTSSGRRYLQGLFQTWETVPLLYVFSEFDKLCISLEPEQKTIGENDLTTLFSGVMEKNLFTFMDAFLRRNGQKAVPLMTGLFVRPDLFLKNTGYMLSQLRNLRAYKELQNQHVGKNQCESILSAMQKGRNVKYLLYRLPKVESYWTIQELDNLICQVFILQLNIRRGIAAVADMGPLICLYCPCQR